MADEFTLDGDSLTVTPTSIDDTDSPYTTQGEQYIYADTTNGAVTVTLATADTVDGREIRVIDTGENASANNITIQTESSENINPGANASISLTVDGTYVDLFSDGSNWFSDRASEKQSVSTGGVGITKPVVHVYPKNGDSPEMVDASAYTTGGAAIQAAIDSLPDSGGKIFIPAEGPDDGVTNGKGTTIDNAWEVTSDIQIPTTMRGIILEGAGAGFGNHKSGGTSLICTDSTVTSVIANGAGWGSFITGLNIDGGGVANQCLDIGRSTANGDYCVTNCVVEDADDGILVTAGGNMWLIGPIWAEHNNLSGININGATGSVWIDNFLTFNNGGIDLRVRDMQQRLWVTSSKFNDPGATGIKIETALEHLWMKDNYIHKPPMHGLWIDGAVTNGHIKDNTIFGASTGNTGTYKSVWLTAALDTVKIDGNILKGNSTADYGVGDNGNSHTELEVTNNKIRGHTAGSYLGMDLADVVVDELYTKSATLTGGAGVDSVAATVTAGSVEQAAYEAEWAPSATGPAADYGVYTRRYWDDSAGDWKIDLLWDVDPGAGNDVSVDVPIHKVQ